MNWDSLNRRIQKGENLHTEFKLWPIQPDDLAANIVAFANTDAGEIFLGVEDNGQIKGIKGDVDQACQFVDNVAYNNCDPPVTVIQETLKSKKDKTILIIHVPKGQQRPYRTNRGVYYIRTSSGRRQASREELLRLFQAVESIYYDEIPILKADPEDFEAQTVSDVLDRIQSQGLDTGTIAQNRLFQNWRLLCEIDHQHYPTLAGVLFLSRDPQQYVPCAYISALQIPGTEIAVEPMDQKRIDGRMLQQFEDAMRFLTIHLTRKHVIKNTAPEIKPELPVETLREAIINALAHRDYTLSAPIRLIVFDNRLEIRTPGQLPNTVTLESLKFGIHVLRNPAIYNMFLRVGLVTDAGSGIPRMIDLIKQATGQEPIFQLEGNEFVVKLPRHLANN